MVIATSKGVSHNTGGGKVLEKLAIFYKLKNKQETMTEKKFNVALAREITGNIKFGQIKTRDGKPARIICWDAKGNYPIVALVDMGEYETPLSYTINGKNGLFYTFDLIIETEGGEV